MNLFKYLTMFLFLTGCGKIEIQEQLREPESLTEARTAMGPLDESESKAAYANGDRTIDIYFGSNGLSSECRYWDLVLSRTDGAKLLLKKTLYTEERRGDSIYQDGNVIRVRSYTFWSVDGMRLQVAAGTTVRMEGTLVTCDSSATSYKSISFALEGNVKSVADYNFQYVDTYRYVSAYNW